MNQNFKNCLARGQITKDPAAKDFADKEIEAAEHDLIRAKKSWDDRDFKWATIQAYYVGFHGVRALLYSRGYRERSHYCLIQAIYALFVDEGLLEKTLLKHLEKIKALREKADYDLEFSPDGAEKSIQVAQKLLAKAKSLL
ncbi:MAG TPA: HEPN domain-containing protein [bacterium]|nr:HEPN domain-containing protein [bacterium]